MSTNGSDDENRPGREVAYRLFATEFDDSVVSYAESDEERAPNYVISPTGARLNRIFVVGTLTEVTDVNDEMVRARVVDPTGAFVVYAGQYQPDALAFLERAEPPAFVAVSGKARTFEPDDGDQVYTSIRPESLAIVDAPTRDRWVVDTAEHTIDRIETYAAAADLDVDDSTLSEVLRANGLPDGPAEGIPLATHHYGTTPAYLDDLREVAIDAVRVVAEDKSQVEATAGSPTETASDAPSYATLADGRSLSIPDDLTTDEIGDDTAVDDVATSTDASAGSAVGTASASPTDSTDDTTASDAVTDDVSDSSETAAAAEPTETEPEADESEGESANTRSEDEGEASDSTEDDEETTDSTGDELGDFETEPSTDADDPIDESVDEASADDSTDGEDEELAADEAAEQASDGDEDSPTDEDVGPTDDEPVVELDTDADDLDPDDFEDGMYELDEDERAAVEEEYGTDFTTGTDVGEPGEADIDVPDAADVAPEGDGPAEDAETSTSGPETDSAASDATDEDATGEDLDLQTRVVEAMGELDDGEGAERSAVVELVADETDADEAAIDDAIQDALMGGECFEPAEDRLQAI